MARSLMILGTGSHVGKSVLAAGICRILADSGLRVAPFKAQNMALNSAATPDGKEIGRAQALQAEACRAVPSADMNPILIKPSSETGAQIVVMGEVWRQSTAADYFGGAVNGLFPTVVEAYRRLAAQYDVVVMEGAGSPAEINLRDCDIVNLRMARAANAPCLLVGDIDRGGVFASLYGTLALLQPEEREQIRGFVINKFRGDLSLLDSGVRMIEDRMDRKCAGVIPHLRDLGLDEEDGVAVHERQTPARAWNDETGANRRLRIAVIALPHMANFTDFNALASEPSVAVAFVERPQDLAPADVVVLPGSKQTVHDLGWLRATGFDGAMRGRSVIGICGGLQMLGTSIEDPAGAENDGVACRVDGLGLLPIGTVMNPRKTTRLAAGSTPMFGGSTAVSGYEIHLGETIYNNGATRFATVDGHPDGAVQHSVWGTYLHGVFDGDSFRHAFIRSHRERLRLNAATELIPYSELRESRIVRWADHLRKHLDIEMIKAWMSL